MAELVATVAEHRAALARDVAAAVLRRPASKCSELLKHWSKRGVLALQSRSLQPGRGRPPFIVAGIADVDAIVQLCGDARDCPAGAVEAFNSEVRPALAAAFAKKYPLFSELSGPPQAASADFTGCHLKQYTLQILLHPNIYVLLFMFSCSGPAVL